MSLKPGRPPWIVPFCRFCDLPVELFTILDVKSPYHVEIDAQCCGRTQGVRISVEQLLHVKRTQEKLYVVVGPRRSQGVYQMRRADAPKQSAAPKKKKVA